MKIKKLEIKGFGKFENLILEFGDGMNLVFGNNETGKTTVQTFIKGVLYGLKGAKAPRSGMLAPVKKYKPWSSRDYNGILEYRLDNGETYRVGRNFDNNMVKVFDSLFNDITSTFESSREKGVQFAEKHLGVNEKCFDKTVFIRQMESRVDEDGSLELLNRLTNVSQTGFDDVSFRRAQDVLAKALKEYVGTDKTSTKPLDRVNARLAQLESIKVELGLKRERLSGLEYELNELMRNKTRLQSHKADLEEVRKIVGERIKIERDQGLLNSLRDILGEISKLETEAHEVKNNIGMILDNKDKLARFSAFDDKSTDEAIFNHKKLLELLQKNAGLERSLQNKMAESTEYTMKHERFKCFEDDATLAQADILRINRELGDLGKEYENGGIKNLNEQISSFKNKFRTAGLCVLASVLAFLLFLISGFMINKLAYAITPFTLISMAVFILKRQKAGLEIAGLETDKRVSFVSLNNLSIEIEKRQNELKGIYNAAYVASPEEFLKVKADFEVSKSYFKQLNDTVQGLKNERSENLKLIDSLKSNLAGILRKAGIQVEDGGDITDEHITTFREGVRKYRSAEPDLNYSKKRIDDIASSINSLIKRGSSISGLDMESADALRTLSGEVEKGINTGEGSLKAKIDGFMTGLSVKGYDQPGIDEFKRRYFDVPASAAFERIGHGLDDAVNEINRVQLDLMEKETTLRNNISEDENLQQIEEEIEELKARKSVLVGVQKSLSLALETLEKASAEIQKDFVPLLNVKMTYMINRITSGRYGDLRADESLTLKTVAPETGDVVVSVELSGGTVDQMYLALRLSMAEMIAPLNEKLPLIMDEVFAQYDGERISETFKYLYELSGERQVILFTCKSREIELAREICGANIDIINL